MRSAALVLVCTVPALWGLYCKSRLRKASAQLGQLVLMTGLIRSQLGYSLPLVEELIEYLSVNSALRELGFLAVCASNLHSCEDFPSVWEKVVKADTELCIGADNKRELIAFGGLLGSTDASGQLMLCDRYSELFSDAAEKARAEYLRLGKVYVSLGAASGVCAAVLLM